MYIMSDALFDQQEESFLAPLSQEDTRSTKEVLKDNRHQGRFSVRIHGGRGLVAERISTNGTAGDVVGSLAVPGRGPPGSSPSEESSTVSSSRYSVGRAQDWGSPESKERQLGEQHNFKISKSTGLIPFKWKQEGSHTLVTQSKIEAKAKALMCEPGDWSCCPS